MPTHVSKTYKSAQPRYFLSQLIIGPIDTTHGIWSQHITSHYLEILIPFNNTDNV